MENNPLLLTRTPPLAGEVRNALERAVANAPTVSTVSDAAYSYERITRGEMWATIRSAVVVLTVAAVLWLAADTTISLISFWPRT